MRAHIAVTLLLATSPATSQELVDIGGRRLEMMRVGSGTPAVVFEAGGGNNHTTWSSILPRVGEFTAAISYSRAGRSKSDPATTPRTPENIVEDLRALLRAAKVAPPYVLVGHSIGALYMRVYAIKYPQEVAGLVLVDGSHERQAQEFARVGRPPAQPPASPPANDVNAQEFAGFRPIMQAGSLGLTGRLPNIPMAVLTAQRVTGQGGETEVMRKVWRELHEDIFRQTSYGIHVVTSKSGHYIHNDEPDLVVNAIRFVVDAVRPAAGGQHQHAAMPTLPATGGAGYTAADVRFMQHMIGHHAQAIAMSALAHTRNASENVRRLAQKIDISQRDEIEMMKAWLKERGQVIPTDAQSLAMMMPGMLTPQQMSQLAAASGRAFDRLFLTFMIGHHEGALQMVEDLFKSPGAGQEPDIFRFATDVDADQRDEIFVMTRMLETLREEPR